MRCARRLEYKSEMQMMLRTGPEIIDRRDPRPPLPVYGWFTKGFATADLKEAQALLDELS